MVAGDVFRRGGSGWFRLETRLRPSDILGGLFQLDFEGYG